MESFVVFAIVASVLALVLWTPLKGVWRLWNPPQMAVACARCGSTEVDERGPGQLSCRRCGYDPSVVLEGAEQEAMRRIEELAIAVSACDSAASAFRSCVMDRVVIDEQHRERVDGTVSDGTRYLDGMGYVAEARQTAEGLGLDDVVQAFQGVPTLQGQPDRQEQAGALEAVGAARDRLFAALSDARARYGTGL